NENSCIGRNKNRAATTTTTPGSADGSTAARTADQGNEQFASVGRSFVLVLEGGADRCIRTAACAVRGVAIRVAALAGTGAIASSRGPFTETRLASVKPARSARAAGWSVIW